ncbi:MAG: hypothetical protein ACQEW0_11385 [Pseudomonadota bacterium]
MNQKTVLLSIGAMLLSAQALATTGFPSKDGIIQAPPNESKKSENSVPVEIGEGSGVIRYSACMPPLLPGQCN